MIPLFQHSFYKLSASDEVIIVGLAKGFSGYSTETRVDAQLPVSIHLSYNNPRLIDRMPASLAPSMHLKSIESIKVKQRKPK